MANVSADKHKVVDTEVPCTELECGSCAYSFYITDEDADDLENIHTCPSCKHQATTDEVQEDQEDEDDDGDEDK